MRDAAKVLGVLAFSIAAIYLLQLAGEPQSIWIWETFFE